MIWGLFNTVCEVVVCIRTPSKYQDSRYFLVIPISFYDSFKVMYVQQKVVQKLQNHVSFHLSTMELHILNVLQLISLKYHGVL